MRDRNWKGTSFEDAKGTIIQRETSRNPNAKVPDASMTNSAEASSSGENSDSIIKNAARGAMNLIKTLGNTDTEFKPNVEAPNYSKYLDLYNKSLDIERRAKETSSMKAKDILTQTPKDILRSINGGGLDVINPNYKLGEASILSSYIKFFGYN